MARIALAAALLGIVSGAYLFSAKQGAAVHIALAAAAFAIAILLAIRDSKAWAAVAALAIAAAIGWLRPEAAVWHAALAQLGVACVALSLVPSKKIDPISPGQWTALRPAALFTPVAIFIQIVMGAMFRHQETGIMPHMMGAMVVALLALVVSVVILQHFGERRELKIPAAILITVVILQVCLGISAFVLLLLESNSTPVYASIATAHVTVGSIALAASVVMAIQVRRNFSAK